MLVVWALVRKLPRMNARQLLDASIELVTKTEPSKNENLAVTHNEIVVELKGKIANLESVVAQQLQELSSNDISMTTASQTIEYLRTGKAATLPSVPTAEPTRGGNLKITLGDGKMRYVAKRPTDSFAVHFDKVPVGDEIRHKLGVKYSYLFNGLDRSDINAFRTIYSLADGTPITTAKGSRKTWLCGFPYLNSCQCERRMATAKEAKEAKEATAASQDNEMAVYISSLRPEITIPEPEPKNTGHNYLVHNPQQGSELAHRLAVKAKQTMAGKQIAHAGLTNEPYDAMINQAIDNGIPWKMLAS